MGNVYLIHFHESIGTDRHSAQHYIGTTYAIHCRLQYHKTSSVKIHYVWPGTGGKLVAHANDMGIEWDAVRIWDTGDDDPFELERKLKARKESPSLCPICNPGGWHNLAEYYPSDDITNLVEF